MSIRIQEQAPVLVSQGVTVPDPSKVGNLRLDDILFRTEEPVRTQLLRAWVDADHLGDGRVRVAPASGKPLTIRWQGREWIFGPEGRRIPRRVAIDLLLNFGEQGLYRGRDQATGFTRLQWTTLKPEVRALYDESQIVFFDDYLTHVVEAEDSGEVQQEKSKKAS
ncbi:hypothetical protein OO015_00545 [Thermomicrobium sp. 4228-Ro]|uniref:hypothetical protein n=1 Tax=Thermomicrobium sp. 4228-Ro TaxID=2993937 RepID=UPI0022490E55|nr:hypothetical protein [Thermomicrobium sp. 4228-Ro]MCX2725996.1 hypothetical protein [Thermomicrobium sp. 4228-Ro]